MSRWFSFSFLLLLLPSLLYGDNYSGRIESVAISPNGKLVAVEFAKAGSSFVYVVPVDTGIASRLTNAKTGKEGSPAFSADGKRVVFTHWPGEGARSRIVITDTDGLSMHEWSPSNEEDRSPVFSPDNKTVVFSRSEFSANYSPIAQPHGHGWSFYASDLNGTNTRQITNEDFYQVSPASISPDGQTMLLGS